MAERYLLPIVLICVLVLLYPHILVKADATSGFPVHNINTGLDYATIQEAINANETLDCQTILVDSGIYDERISINKSISLIGENRDNTILNWTVQSWDISVINITANHVKLTGFSILGWAGTKVAVSSCSNVTIRDDVIQSTGTCIVLYGSKDCNISDNTILGGGLEGNDLLELSDCDGCLIENNSVRGACYEGIGLHSTSNTQVCNNQLYGDGHAICLESAYGNVIFNNSISVGGSYGIKLTFGSGNVIFSNTISGCWNGIEFETTSGNTIFGNNFEGNYNQVYGSFTGNSLSHSSVGNYYSDYKGSDIDQDGIGDTPYLAEYFPQSFANVDYFPLVGTYQTFTVNSSRGQSQSFTVISNSTVSGFSLYYSVPSSDTVQSDQPFIKFIVTGENGTTGFCRLAIPKAILNSSSYIVFVDNRQVNVKLLPNSDNNYVTVYFTYIHSSHQVLIFIPEFPSFVVLSIFILATLLAVIFYRKAHGLPHNNGILKAYE
jgi:parallel beta-helix repeat protein